MSLTSWFDASTLSQTDGTVITSWPDLSASTKNAESTAPRAPIVKTAIQNGLRSVLFDGIDDWMNWHPVDTTKFSRFVAFKWVGTTTQGSGDPRIWAGYSCWLAIHTADNSLRVHFPRGTTSGDYRTPANTITAGTAYLLEVYKDMNNTATPPEIWLNGVQVVVNTIAVESGIRTTDTYNILGNSTDTVNGPRSINAHFFEARFFNTILLDSERASNRSEILSKWAIAGSVKAQNTSANEQTNGNIPIITLSKDTIRGKINYAGSLSLVRHVSGPSKKQSISSTIGFNGQITRKFAKRKLVGGLSLTGKITPQITNLVGTSISSNLGLSGRLIPAIVVSKKHHCKECIKRWAHRWFSRSD